MSNNIVSINDELYNYLNDVNYGMSKPQFNHLTTIVNGSINLPGTKTLSKIALLYFRQKMRVVFISF